ncbi:MAG: DUF4082 domain-containing protein, partial [Elusimicrobia bacterium]|nr:DUF4082 domain-containing protein [Elusimicrobiota bacterium]
TYTWSATRGQISGTGNKVTYTAPAVSVQQSYTVTVTVADGQGGATTKSVAITVNPVTEQTPWKTNQNGTLYTNQAYNYTMGYHFTPTKDGKIVKLGGCFNGTKTVKIWNKSTGALLKSINLSSGNAWKYVNLAMPLNVTAGTTYTVAVVLGGSGGSYRSDISALPKTYGDIKITGSTYASGTARPTNSVTTIMYGQTDIGFVGN